MMRSALPTVYRFGRLAAFFATGFGDLADFLPVFAREPLAAVFAVGRALFDVPTFVADATRALPTTTTEPGPGMRLLSSPVDQWMRSMLPAAAVTTPSREG